MNDTVRIAGSAYPHVAARMFNTPLLLAPDKAEVIVAALSPRLFGTGPTAGGPTPDDPRDLTITDTGVAIVPISGTLVRRHDWVSAASGLTSYEHIRAMVEDAVTDPRVRALLLDIDSPGGEVAGLFDLVDLLSEAGQVKPLWAVANDQAYSAAYGIASACQRVYVTRTGGVGSVGVIAVHLDTSAADRAQGLAYTVCRAGKYKAEHNSYEPLTDHARQTMQDELDRLYALFAGQVARNRGLTIDQVTGQEAQVYRGQAGVDHGLADAMGTLEHTLTQLEQQLQQPPPRRWAATASAQPTASDPQEDTMTIATQQAPSTATAVAPQDPGLDPEQLRAEAVAQDRAYQKEVRELCRLAGNTQLADAFIDRQVSVEQVRSVLLDERAKADEAAQVTATIEAPGQTAAPDIDLRAVYAQRNRYHRAAVAGAGA